MQAVIKECGQTEDSVPTLKQLLANMGITQVCDSRGTHRG
jgi:hypothetical protein